MNTLEKSLLIKELHDLIDALEHQRLSLYETAKAKAIKNAVGVAIDFAEKDVVRHIGESIINKRKGNE